jgi:hypothetical protein
MGRLSLAIAAIALSAAASTPARADPFHLIRWSDTGFCQIWDEGIPTQPWPGNYTVVSMTVATFFDALNLKNGMLWTHECSL